MKYGLFGSISVSEGNGSVFSDILMEGTKNMPGCLRYDIGTDLGDPDKVWVYELWETKEMHEASLALPSVQEAIKKGMPLIKAFGDKAEFIPRG